MSMNGYVRPNASPQVGSLHIVVVLELAEWLMLSQKGIQDNLPLEILPGQTVTGTLNAQGNNQYVLLESVQFDGVQSGQVGFEFISGRQRIAGYAVQAFVQPELLLSEKGQGIRYTISSSQLSTAVVNIDYVSVPSHVVDNEIRPAMDAFRIGAR